MTSAEFAAKYRLLKRVPGKGARSHLAQQTDLGRAVLVHFLDVGSPDDRRRLLERTLALPGEAREKVLETGEVDGIRVIVTRFAPGLEDLQAWIAESERKAAPPAAAAPAAGGPAGGTSEFVRVFGAGAAGSDASPGQGSPGMVEMPTAQMEAVSPRAATSASSPPSRPSPAAAPEPGEFTRLFKGMGASGSAVPSANSGPPVNSAPAAVPPAPAFSSPGAVPRVSSTPPTAAPPPPAPSFSNQPPPVPPGPVPSRPAATGASAADSGFTGIFGKSPASEPGAVNPPFPFPAAPESRQSIMPPVSPVEPPRPAPKPAAPASPPSSGEFTQLFERLATPTGSAPSIAPPPVAVPVPQPPPRPIVAVPPPIAVPSFGAPVSPPQPPPSPSFKQPPPPVAAPALPSISALPGAGQPIIPLGLPGAAPPAMPVAPNHPAPPASSGGSEFTRILGRVGSPPQGTPLPLIFPQSQAPLPAAPPSPVAPGDQPPARRLNLPVIIAINIVVIATLAVIFYFFFRH